MIFKYQVWDLQTGKSALEQVFSSGVQLSPFTYLCHLGTALEKYGILFSGIDTSLSLCNIALLNTVCHHLFFFECFRRTLIWKEFRVFEKLSIINSLTGLNSVLKQLDETEVETAEQQCKLLKELGRVIRMKHLNIRLQRLAVLGYHAEVTVGRLTMLELRDELEQMLVLEHA